MNSREIHSEINRACDNLSGVRIHPADEFKLEMNLRNIREYVAMLSKQSDNNSRSPKRRYQPVSQGSAVLREVE